ncbi:MAG: CdaR family protein, partial [Chloroflexota bacterium]
DDQGKPVQGLRASPQTVQVFLGVNQQVGTKTVPVRVTTAGQVASGYWLSSLSVNPETVTISGGPSALRAVSYFDIPPLDLSNAKSDVTRTSKIAPNGRYTILGTTQVSIHAVVTPLRGSKTVMVNVTVQGAGPGLESLLNPSTVEVTLSGLVPSLSSLKAGDVSAVANVSGLAAGVHSVPVRISSPGSLAVDVSRPDHISVTLRAPPTPTVTPAQTGTPSPTTASPPASGTASPSSSASAKATARPASPPASASATPAASPSRSG